MLLNYLKLSLRLLARNPFFTFINVAGLSVGFAVFFILWQYSQSELNSDRQWKDWDRTYRLGMIGNITDDGGSNYYQKFFGNNDPALTQQATELYDEIESSTFVWNQHTFGGEWGDFKYTPHDSDLFFTLESASQVNATVEKQVVYGKSNLFSFFGIKLTEGNPSTCLNLAGSIVLSVSKAKQYFGSKKAIGNTLLLNGKIPFTVTGIFNDLSKNTHLDFDIVLSAENLKGTTSDIHNAWWGPHCYIKLKNRSSANELVERMNTDLTEMIAQATWANSDYYYGTLYLQPLTEVSFGSYYNDTHQTKSKSVLKIFQYAAIVILLMAWANYINLTVSSNRKRVKEMTVRKTVGAMSKDFLSQYVLESVLVNMISLLLGVTIIQLIKPLMEILFHFYIPPWSDFTVASAIIALSGLAIMILLSSFYPALVLLNKSPKNPFGKPRIANEKYRFVSFLTILQFTGALILLIWIFAVYGQINLVLSADIGFNKEQTLVLDLPVNRTDHFETELHSFISEVLAIGDISNYTLCQSVPGDKVRINHMYLPQLTGVWIGVESNGGVDENFLPFFDIQLLAGRNFIPEHPADSSSILLSVAAARRIGFNPPESAVGQKLRADRPVEIIGVFRDYKIRPLFDEVYPEFEGGHGLALAPRNYQLKTAPYMKASKVALHIASDRISQAIPAIKDQYGKLFPGEPFNWYFLDQVVDGQYQQHEYARNQIMLFACIAIVIACLGLLGMISNKIVMKTKEIGIRKVLGAQLHQIAQLLVNPTLNQLVIATAIGIPAAYYITQQYLERFTIRISLQWWLFTIPIIILTSIMFLTISAVLWKAAKNNPVEALKYE